MWNSNNKSPQITGNIKRYDLLNGLGECGCNKTMNGLGELTDDEAEKIATDHYRSLPATTLLQIGIEAGSGSAKTFAQESKKVAEKICSAGATSRITDYLTHPVAIVAEISLAAIAIKKLFWK